MKLPRVLVLVKVLDRITEFNREFVVRSGLRFGDDYELFDDEEKVLESVDRNFPQILIVAEARTAIDPIVKLLLAAKKKNPKLKTILFSTKEGSGFSKNFDAGVVDRREHHFCDSLITEIRKFLGLPAIR